MRSYIDCVHCYLKQAVSCMNCAGVDEDRQHEILFKTMDIIKNLDRQNTPAENSTEVLLSIYQQIGVDDPFHKAKQQSNELAQKLYPALHKYLETSPNRLYDALKISVAGNVIDLGINRDFDIEASLDFSLKVGFSKDHFQEFQARLDEVDEVLFIGDNAGEIVFDRVLLEELVALGKKVTYVVKGGPILNDSTMEDAVFAGIDKVASVITTGCRYLGVAIKHSSQEFINLLEAAKLIISKGQANFESLESEDRFKGKVFFLLKIKCEGVGTVAEANFGDVVFFHK